MRLRVLHLGKYYPPTRGGMETYLQDLCQALEQRDVECLALVHHDRGGQASTREQRREGLPAIWRVSAWATLLYTPLSPGLPAALHRALREFRPQILHLHWPNPWALLALCSPAARQIPWVVHWHSDIVPAPDSSPLFRLAYRLLAPLERRLLKRSRCVIATSEAYRASSLPLRAFQHKVCVVPLGRAEELRPNTRPKRRSEGRLQLLAAGRLAHYKGFDVLLHAVERCEGVSLTLIGDGEERASLAALVDKLNLAQRVELLGAASQEQLLGALARCDCVVLPSTERTEAFGVTLLEAMIAEKATIASDIPGSGIGSVIEHGKTGLLTRPNDVADLAAAILTLRDAPELTFEMGKAGRERFEQLFHIDYSADQVLAIYRALAS